MQPAWVDGLTIPQVLDKTAEAHGARDALVFPKLGLRMNYSEFRTVVNQCAKGLLALGVVKGDHVAIWATNVPEWPILQMATARIGAVLVTVNPANRVSEVEYVLRQSQSKVLVMLDQFKTSDYYAMIGEICPEVKSCLPAMFESKKFPHLKRIVGLRGTLPQGALPWDALMGGAMFIDDAKFAKACEGLDCHDTINIQYTSGTTGFPKAAMLTHRNLLMNGFYIAECQNITEQDRMCIPVPYYHCFGCVMGNLGALTHGAAMVIPAEYFCPKSTLDAIEKERATTIYGVPTMFIAMLDHESFAGRDLTSLRSGIMAGSPCPIEVMKRVVEVMGAKEITIAYGQTETAPVITQTRTDDPIEVRTSTVGRELPGVEVKIVDEHNKPVPQGTQGELCARGHGAMKGYWANPEATAATIDSEGYVHTGDLAIQLPDGNYKITGRLKEMVIRGGENIYPREIEEFLFTHPAVENVTVVGVPDEKYGEETCACIILRKGMAATEEEIRNFCKGKIAHYKVPKYVKFMTEFPLTVSGKIQKFKLRESLSAELGLKEQETA